MFSFDLAVKAKCTIPDFWLQCTFWTQRSAFIHRYQNTGVSLVFSVRSVYLTIYVNLTPAWGKIKAFHLWHKNHWPCTALRLQQQCPPPNFGGRYTRISCCDAYQWWRLFEEPPKVEKRWSEQTSLSEEKSGGFWATSGKCWTHFNSLF